MQDGCLAGLVQVQDWPRELRSQAFIPRSPASKLWSALLCLQPAVCLRTLDTLAVLRVRASPRASQWAAGAGLEVSAQFRVCSPRGSGGPILASGLYSGQVLMLASSWKHFGRAFPQPRGASSWVVVSQFFCDCVFLPRCGSPAGRAELGLQVLFWVLQLQRCRTRASRLPGVKMLPAPPLQ